MRKLIATYGSISDIVMALTAALAVAFSVRAWFLSKITFKHQILNDLFREYRSPEMGLVIRRMHELYASCSSDENKLIKKYVKAYTDEKDKKESIHFQRRRISGFYQQIAALSDKDARYRKIVYAMWNKKDLEIIPKILIPIETKAIPIALGNRPAMNYTEIKESFKRMLRLYEDAPE
jgi:hypothetical protein